MRVKQMIAMLKQADPEKRLDIILHEDGDERDLSDWSIEVHRLDTDDDYVELFINDGTL